MTEVGVLKNDDYALGKTFAERAVESDQAARRYKAAAEHLSCDLNGESVILNMKNGKYYGINQVGASIWATLQGAEPIALDEICAAIIREYQVDEAVCAQEVTAFLKKMLREGLVEVA